MSEIKFTGCQDLDYSESYRPACSRQMLANGKLFWMRPSYYVDNRMVQFCKKRGRLNNPESCLCENRAVCSEYEEIEHIIDVDDSEIEGGTE